MKKVLKTVFLPGLPVCAACVLATVLLQVFVRLSGTQDGPLVYGYYALSAYALVIVCAGVIRAAKRRIGAALHRNPYVSRYLTDVAFKTHVSLYLSLGINLCFAAMKLYYGGRYQSVWFGTLGVYYIMLAEMRFLLLRHIRRISIGQALTLELKQYRMCGIILVLMNIALLGIVILVVTAQEGFSYDGYTIYVVALYAFYNVISAVMDLVKYRSWKSPVMAASRAIKFSAALVSMLSLETAMLAQFGGDDDLLFHQRITAITGACVCLAVFVTAVYMIVRSTVLLRRGGAARSEMEESP